MADLLGCQPQNTPFQALMSSGGAVYLKVVRHEWNRPWKDLKSSFSVLEMVIQSGKQSLKENRFSGTSCAYHNPKAGTSGVSELIEEVVP
jgi:hypothetical protein